MPGAAITPRVQVMVICSEVIASEIESDVFTLEGVRQYLVSPTCPCVFRPYLFLVLSNARRGVFHGVAKIQDEGTNRVIRYGKFDVTFERDRERRPMYINLGACRFPEFGEYNFQVWFSAQGRDEVLKGEQVFEIVPALE